MARDGILLIGGNGFLGSALAKSLAAAGRRVHVLSRSIASGLRKGIVFHRGSQDDESLVMPILKECSVVVHLASTTTPGISAKRPVMDVEENLLPAARFLEILAMAPPSRLLLLSSGGALYGNPRYLPVDEVHPVSPLSSHAAGKAALESFFSAFANSSNVSLAILRPSNLYGPGQPLRTGFGIVRTLLEKARHGEPIEIWGDGETMRDYLYIDDAVDACVRLIDAPEAIGPFNVGSGYGTSTNRLVKLTEELTGCAIPVIRRPERDTDVRAVVLDSTRLRETTGWTANTLLKDGLRSTWERLQGMTE